MGKTCVAANCTNRTEKNKEVTFHSFPNKIKDSKRYAEWIRQVKRTRAEWNGRASAYTYVCSDHFTPDSYESKPMLMKEMGFPVARERRLNATAVPTVFSRGESSEATATKKRRTAFEKREKQRTLDDILSSPSASNISGQNDIEDDTLNILPTDMDISMTSGM